MSNKNGYRQSDREMETGDYFFRTVGVMKRRENIKVAIRPMDSTTILSWLTLGK